MSTLKYSMLSVVLLLWQGILVSTSFVFLCLVFCVPCDRSYLLMYACSDVSLVFIDVYICNQRITIESMVMKILLTAHLTLA